MNRKCQWCKNTATHITTINCVCDNCQKLIEKARKIKPVKIMEVCF